MTPNFILTILLPASLLLTCSQTKTREPVENNHTALQESQHTKSKIEVYLLNSSVASDEAYNGHYYFQPSANELAVGPLIADEEILGYEIRKDTAVQNNRGYHYTIILTESGKKKMNDLGKIDLMLGRRFAIAVDKKPVFGGYFWNISSSFFCDWISVTVFPGMNTLSLGRGIPDSYGRTDKTDPRCDPELLNAFRGTSRLVEK